MAFVKCHPISGLIDFTSPGEGNVCLRVFKRHEKTAAEDHLERAPLFTVVSIQGGGPWAGETGGFKGAFLGLA
jgi:hypothetical protein